MSDSASGKETADAGTSSAAALAFKHGFRSLDADLMRLFDGTLDDIGGVHDQHAGNDARCEGGLDADNRLGKTGFTASWITLDPQGRALTALLGPGEIYAPDPRRLIIALWSGSRANQNALRTGRAKLDFVHGDCFYQLHLTIERSTPSSDASSYLTLHLTTLEEGEGQRVPYATLTSGIRYQLADRAHTLDIWHRQLQAMRAFAASD